MENDGQLGLRKWIQAGLAIREVHDLNGDAGYIFNNMIAKYTLAAATYRVSVKAERVLRRSGVRLDRPVRRGAIYGKSKPTVFEHAVPATIVRTQLLDSSGSSAAIKQVLARAGPVAIILREEDALLNRMGLSQKMPEGWKWGDDVLDRYRRAGIVLTDRGVRMTGAIKR